MSSLIGEENHMNWFNESRGHKGNSTEMFTFDCTTDLVPKGNARNLSGNLYFYEGVVAYYLVMLLVSVKAVANFVTTIFNY